MDKRNSSLPYVRLSRISTNQTTGPIPVSTTESRTCPPACPFAKDNLCYAKLGPIAWQWKKVSGDWQAFLSDVEGLPSGQLWRHNQAGDLPGLGNRIDAKALSQLVEASKRTRGFTYTHKPVLYGQASKSVIQRNRAAILQANQAGFTVNLSANSLRHADELADLGIGPVVSVVPSDYTGDSTPEGRRVIVCPNKAGIKNKQGKVLQCIDCKLCSLAHRSFIIAFPAHGTKHAQVSAISSQY